MIWFFPSSWSLFRDILVFITAEWEFTQYILCIISIYINFNRSFSYADTSVCIRIMPYTVSKCPHPELLFTCIFSSLLSGVWYTIFILIWSLRTVEKCLYSVICIEVCSNKDFLVLSRFLLGLQYKPHYDMTKNTNGIFLLIQLCEV